MAGLAVVIIIGLIIVSLLLYFLAIEQEKTIEKLEMNQKKGKK